MGVTVTGTAFRGPVEPAAEGASERLSAGEILSTLYTDTVIPDAKDKAKKSAVGLVLCSTKSRTCGEVDVKELEGRMAALSSESGDLETST